jgi:putative ABC transport system substrate-binding protein
MVGTEGDADSKARIAALQQGLRDNGWQDGHNIHIEYRWGSGRPDLIRQYAEELVALAPDVIVANGTPAIAALKPLTRSIPIVCALVIDPVGLELVETLARPGGNITGYSFINVELIGKWTALLKEVAPALTRAAVLYNPKANPWYANFQREIAATPQLAAIELVTAPVETIEDLQSTIQKLGHARNTGLIIGPDAFVITQIQTLAHLTAAHRVPCVSVYRQFAMEGGLMSYGPDVPEIFRRSAGYVDLILKGANPAELPVQQPTKFEFLLNQKAAAALGLIIPEPLLASADEVIE